jgi:hypothetical protein
MADGRRERLYFAVEKTVYEKIVGARSPAGAGCLYDSVYAKRENLEVK